ncbi:hypothetical protein B0O99DRAFT_101884 [Bisporella sp. PMI_857]|nr:hypothetical protein B0O99DRAFT_101884 [Bisporella sp. PMI_857]
MWRIEMFWCAWLTPSIILTSNPYKRILAADIPGRAAKRLEPTPPHIPYLTILTFLIFYASFSFFIRSRFHIKCGFDNQILQGLA